MVRLATGMRTRGGSGTGMTWTGTGTVATSPVESRASTGRVRLPKMSASGTTISVVPTRVERPREWFASHRAVSWTSSPSASTMMSARSTVTCPSSMTSIGVAVGERPGASATGVTFTGTVRATSRRLSATWRVNSAGPLKFELGTITSRSRETETWTSPPGSVLTWTSSPSGSSTRSSRRISRLPSSSTTSGRSATRRGARSTVMLMV